MAWRTTEAEVRKIVETDEADPLDLSPFIDMANALTDQVSVKDADSALSASMLLQIEKLLSAHFYCLRDQRLQSKGEGGASGAFQGQTGKGLECTDYGCNAIAMDVTGYLGSLSGGRKKASLTWLGKPVSEQTDYEDRD